MNARERARAALNRHDLWLNGGPDDKPSHSEWAAIVRDLLAEPPGLTAVEVRTLEEAITSLRYRSEEPIAVAVEAIIARLSPAPTIKRGTRVRWHRGEDSGTGTYWGVFDGLHQVTLCAIKGDMDEARVRMVACNRCEPLAAREGA